MNEAKPIGSEGRAAFPDIVAFLRTLRSYPDEVVAAAAIEAVSRIEELERRNAEVAMLAHNWMVAHDMRAAGKTYSYPAPADLPNALQSLQRQLEEAREALRPFASVGHGLIPRKAGGWHRVNDFGRKEVILDITFSDLEPFRLAASTLGRVEGSGSSNAISGPTPKSADPEAEPSGRWCCPECGTETSHVPGCTIAEDTWKWVPDTVMPPYDVATQEGDPRFDGAEAYEAHLSARPAQMVNPELVPDSRADQTGLYWLTKAMEAKLEAKRAEGYGGWHRPSECTVDHLARLLIEHLPKGDPVDIANFCMMLHYRDGGADALTAAAAMCAERLVLPRDAEKPSPTKPTGDTE